MIYKIDQLYHNHVFFDMSFNRLIRELTSRKQILFYDPPIGYVFGRTRGESKFFVRILEPKKLKKNEVYAQ